MRGHETYASLLSIAAVRDELPKEAHAHFKSRVSFITFDRDPQAEEFEV